MCIRFLKTVVLTGLFLCLLEPVSALAKGDQSTEDNKPDSEPTYIIQPNDLLEIVVWGGAGYLSYRSGSTGRADFSPPDPGPPGFKIDARRIEGANGEFAGRVH